MGTVDTAGLCSPGTKATWAKASWASWASRTSGATLATPHAWTTPLSTSPAAGSGRETGRAGRDPAGPLSGVPAATRTKTGAGGDLRRPGRTSRGSMEGCFLGVGDGHTSVGTQLGDSTKDSYILVLAACSSLLFQNELTHPLGRWCWCRTLQHRCSIERWRSGWSRDSPNHCPEYRSCHPSFPCSQTTMTRGVSRGKQCAGRR